MELDEKDFKILSILEKNSKMSIKDISKVSGIAQTTVHNRIKRLEDEGLILGYTLKLNQEKLGNTIQAFILINIDYEELKDLDKSQRDVVLEILKIKDIKEASIVAGETDIIAKVYTTSMSELNSIVVNNLRYLEGVSGTRTVLVLEHVQ